MYLPTTPKRQYTCATIATDHKQAAKKININRNGTNHIKRNKITATEVEEKSHLQGSDYSTPVRKQCHKTAFRVFGNK